MPATRPRTARQRHQPRPVTRADLARKAGKARSTVTEALQGRLRCADLGNGRVDAAHPEVLRWAGVKTYEQLVRGEARRRARPSAAPAEREPVELVMDFDDPRYPSVDEVVRRLPKKHRPTIEVAELELANALIPVAHQPLCVVAQLAGVPLKVALAAARAELAPAVTTTGHIDITSESALRFFAAYPLTERAMLEADDAHGFPLGDAYDEAGDMLDANHPFVKVLLARTTGAIEVAS